MKKTYLVWSVEKFNDFCGREVRNPVEVLIEEARQKSRCSATIQCDNEQHSELATVLDMVCEGEVMYRELSQEVYLYVYRGSDYESPEAAHKDGALYYAQVSATLDELADTEHMKVLNAIASATSDCINNDMSEIKMAWFDEGLNPVAEMEDLL